MRSAKPIFRTGILYGKNFLSDRRGASATVFALALIPMLLAAGGAVDFTRYYDAQQTVQTALDAATLAGATVYDGTNGSDAQNVATKTFNSWDTTVDGRIKSTGFTPASSTSALDLTGKAVVSFNMYFTGLIGLKTLNFTVTSKAERTVGSTSSGGGTCLWITTGGLTMNSGGKLSAPSCEVDVIGGTTSLNSSSTVITPSLCIASGLNVNKNGGSVNDSDGNSSLNTSCTTTSYTIPATAPSVSCDANAVSTSNKTYDYNSNPSVTLEPGTYCKGVTFNGGSDADHVQQITLKSGMYIINNGDFIFDGYTKVIGSGITFYLSDGSYIYFNSDHVSSVFTAPTSGDCEDTNSCGVLMYEADGLSMSYMSGFDRGTSHTWTGNVYLPSRTIQENSSASMSLDGNLVLYGFTINSSSVWNLTSDGATTTTSSYGPPRLVK